MAKAKAAKKPRTARRPYSGAAVASGAHHNPFCPLPKRETASGWFGGTRALEDKRSCWGAVGS